MKECSGSGGVYFNKLDEARFLADWRYIFFLLVITATGGTGRKNSHTPGPCTLKEVGVHAQACVLRKLC